MMKTFVACVAFVLCVASLQAITVNWAISNVTPEPSDLKGIVSTASQIALIQSADALDYDGVLAALNGSTGVYAANKSDKGVMVSVGPNNAGLNYVRFQGIENTDGNFYVVFVSSDAEPLYAVSNAVTYTTTADGKPDAGWILDDADGSAPVTTGGLVQASWMADSTWKAVTVPEPTVLALLALGVAGVALRRKH